MNPSKRKESLAKPVIKGVVGAGAAAVLLTGVVGMTPVLALPIAAAGVVYAKMKAKSQAPSQSNVKVWSVIAGVGVGVAAVTNTLDMLPGFASASFVMASVAPLAANRLKSRLSERRQAQPVSVAAPITPNGSAVSGRESAASPAPDASGLVNVAVPASMADRVAQFVETLQANPDAQPSPTPNRTRMRPS